VGMADIGTAISAATSARQLKKHLGVGVAAFVLGALFITGCRSESKAEVSVPPSARLTCSSSSGGFSYSVGGPGGAATAEEALNEIPQAVATLEAKPSQVAIPTTEFVSTGDDSSEMRVFAHVEDGRTTATVEVTKTPSGGWLITGMKWCT